MTISRVFALLALLCVGCPSWAAATSGWQGCEMGRTVRCRTVFPNRLDLSAPLTLLTTLVRVPHNAVGEPLAVDIDAMASAEVRWNGVVIGRNGVPGTSRVREVPGRYSVSLSVPTALIRPGGNRVTILLSSHHRWLPVAQPIHRIAIGPRQDAAAYTFRHYFPTLATLALPAVVLAALAALMSAGRIGRAALPVVAVLAAIVAQGLVEISKLAVAYTYPWHIVRLISLTALTAIVGLLLVGLMSRLLARSRTMLVVAVTGVAMIAAWQVVGGPDRQSLAAFVIAMLASAAAAIPAAIRRRDQRALLIGLLAILLAAWAYVAGPDFLDAGYYVAAAGAAAVLGLAAILRPVPIVKVPVAGPAIEPTVTLRDGARRHVIVPSEVVFLKAHDDYCSLHLADGREVMVTMTLKATLALLPADFVRIHRGHAVNIRHLRGTRAGSNGRLAQLPGSVVLPIGRAYLSVVRTITEAVATPTKTHDLPHT